jgi:hypothetical protein
MSAMSNVGERSSGRNPQWRKQLLQFRARLCEAWDRAFPKHNFFTGRLRCDVDHALNEDAPVDAHWRKVAQDAWNNPGWAKAALEYHKVRGDRVLIVETKPEQLARLRELRDDNVSLDRLWYELNDARSRPTPQVTIEALLSCVRERGVSALNEPINIERLSRCHAGALGQIDARLAQHLNGGGQ